MSIATTQGDSEQTGLSVGIRASIEAIFRRAERLAVGLIRGSLAEGQDARVRGEDRQGARWSRAW